MPATPSKEWLSLQEASERLGISPATLRLWADRGRVHAFRTPGGHRRFRERDLAALAAERDSDRADQSLRVLAHAAVGRARFEISDGWLRSEQWYENFPPKAREKHRELGRQVVMSLSELLSSSGQGDPSLKRAEELGGAYAELNMEYGIALADSLRAFIYFRDSYIESLIELSRTQPALDMMPLMRLTSRFVDEMLLTMVETQMTQLGSEKGEGRGVDK